MRLSDRNKRDMISYSIFTMVIISFLSCFIPEKHIDTFSLYALDLLGYSILTNIIIYYFVDRYKFCIHVKLALQHLILLNIVNILDGFGVFKDYNIYSYNYDIICASLVLISFVVLLIFKTKKK